MILYVIYNQLLTLIDFNIYVKNVQRIYNVMLFSKLYKENNMISFKQKEFSTEIIIIMKLLQI